jgi:hypothetical protein
MSQEIISRFFTNKSIYTLCDYIQNDSFEIISSVWTKERRGSSREEISLNHLVDYLNSKDNLSDSYDFCWEEVLSPDSNGSSLRKELYLNKLVLSKDRKESSILQRKMFHLGGRIIWYNPDSKSKVLGGWSGVVNRIELNPFYSSFTGRQFG